MRSTILVGSVAAAATVVSFASADTFPTPSPFSGSSSLAGGSSSLAGSMIFEHGTETGSRYNPQSNPGLPGGYVAANTIAFTNCVFDGGNTSAILDTLRFGIRQGGGSPDVDLRIFVGQMDTDGNLVTSSVADLGVINLAGNGGTSFVTTVVDFAAGGYEVAMNDLAGSGNPGFSGFFVGMRFEGAGSTSNLNGWRITNAPAVGQAFNYFAAYDPTVPINGNWSFSDPTPSYFYLDIEGTLVPAPGAIALLGLAGLAGSRRRRG
jgi:hypothetical protein